MNQEKTTGQQEAAQEPQARTLGSSKALTFWPRVRRFLIRHPGSRAVVWSSVLRRQTAQHHSPGRGWAGSGPIPSLPPGSSLPRARVGRL